MEFYKVSQIIEKPISGEWGDEPQKGDKNLVKVIRTINFSNIGRLNLDKDVVLRKIDQSIIDKKKLTYGDIIIEKSGGSPDQPVGRVVFFDRNDGDYLCNNFTSIIRPKEKVYSKYLLYFLLNNHLNKQTLKFQNKTTGIINLQLNNYLQMTVIPIPSIEVQKKIAQVLDKAQQLIDKKKEQIKKLDEFIQSVFSDMFGDPTTNPQKWRIGRIKDLTAYTQYGTSKKAFERKGNYPILRMNNITYNGGWDFSSLKYIDLDENECKKYLVYNGEILFNRTNSKELVGKTAVYRGKEPMAFAGYLVKLVHNTKSNSDFISAFLNSKYGKSILYLKAKSIVGMANINAEELKNINIYMPPLDLQNKFAAIVQKTEQQKEILQKGLTEFENNYNSLMQRAFKGELFS